MENNEEILFCRFIETGLKLIKINDDLSCYSNELIDRRIFKKSLDVELQLRNFYGILDIGEKRKILIPIKFQLLLEENCWDRLHDNEYDYFYCSYCDLATKNCSLSKHINSAAHKINIDKTVSLYRFISHSIQIIVKQHELKNYKVYIDQKVRIPVNSRGFLNLYYSHILKDNLFKGVMLPVPNLGLINEKEIKTFQNIEYWVTKQISLYSKSIFSFACFDCNEHVTSPIEFFNHFIEEKHNKKYVKLSRCLIFCHACKLLFHTIRDNIEVHIDSNIHLLNVVPNEICSDKLENSKENIDMGHELNEQFQNVSPKVVNDNSLKVASIISINRRGDHITKNEVSIEMGAQLDKILFKEIVMLFLGKRKIKKNINDAKFYCMACNLNFSASNVILDHYYSKKHGKEESKVNKNSTFIFCHICDSFLLTLSDTDVADHANVNHKSYRIKNISKESNTMDKTIDFFNIGEEIYFQYQFKAFLERLCCVYINRESSMNVENIDSLLLPKHDFTQYLNDMSEWIRYHFFGLKMTHRCISYYCSTCQEVSWEFESFVNHLKLLHFKLIENLNDDYCIIFCDSCTAIIFSNYDEDINYHLISPFHVNMTSEYENLGDGAEDSNTNSFVNSENDVTDHVNTNNKEKIMDIKDETDPINSDCTNLLIDAIEIKNPQWRLKERLNSNLENLTCMVEKFTYVYSNQCKAGTSENNPTIDGTILRFPDRKFYKISDPEKYLIRITDWILSQFGCAKSVLKVSCSICGVNPPDILSLWQHIVGKKHSSNLMEGLCLAVFCLGCSVFDIDLQKEKIKHNCRKSKNNGNDQNTNNKEGNKLIKEQYSPGSYTNPDSEPSESINRENHAVRLPIYDSGVGNKNISVSDVINKPKNDNDECSIFDRSTTIPFAIDFSILEENIYLTKEVLNDLRETFASYNMLKGILQTDIINTLKPHYPQTTVFFCGPHEIGLAKHQCTLKIFVDIDETSNLSVIENISELFSHHSSLFSVDRSLIEGKEQKLLLKHVYTETKCQICFHNLFSIMEMNLFKLYLAFDCEIYWLVATVREWAMAQSILKEAVFDVQTIMYFILFFLMQPSQNIIPSVQTLMDINHKDEIIFNGWKYFLQNNSTIMKKPIENAGANYKSKSILLSNFFQYYSLIKFSGIVLCPFTGNIIRRTVFTSGHPPVELKSYSTKLKQELDFSAPLIILDPFNCNNNLASNVDQSALQQFTTCCQNSFNSLTKDS